MTTQTLTLPEFLLARLAEDREMFGGCEVAVYPWAPRMVAETKAKRRIVEICNQHGTLQSIEILTHLALVYADHPDYRDEWKP